MAQGSRSVFVFLLALVPMISFAGTDSLARAPGLGTHSFLFGIDDLIQLSDFFNGTISYKYHKSPETAFRLAVSFSANQRSDTLSDSYSFSYRTDSFLYGYGSLRVQYLCYPNPLAGIKLFYGAGPYIQADYSKQVSVRTSYYPNEKIDRRDNGVTVGISAPLGLEWLFAPKFGLVVEYSITACYYWDTISYYYNTRLPENDKSQGWRVDPRGIRLGLSVYL
jgi:hypothetical protein